MAKTTWYFALLPGDRFVRYPATGYDRFWRGNAPLQLDVIGAVSFLEVELRLRAARAERFLRAEYPRHVVGPDGYVRRGSTPAWPPQRQEDRPDPVVLGLEARLRERWKNEPAFWTPTPAQLESACEAIHREAGVELVWHDGRGLRDLRDRTTPTHYPPLRLV